MKRKILSLLFCLALFLGVAHAEEGEEIRWAVPFRDIKTGLYCLLDPQDSSTPILPAEYDYIGHFSDDGCGLIQKGSLWGLVDVRGNFILPIEYLDVNMGDDGIANLRNQEGLWAYFRVSDGTFLTDFCFDGASEFHQLGVVCKMSGNKNLYGAVNAQGETIIPFEYDHLSDPLPDYYSERIIWARKGDYSGAFNYDGTLLRRCIYPSDPAMQLSLALPAQMTEEAERAALVAASQTWEPAYDEWSGKWGYRPTVADVAYLPSRVIYNLFASAQPFDSSGHARVTYPDGRSGYIDSSGTFFMDPLSFSDVPTGSWFEQGVKTCAEQGIMVGTGAGMFSPEGQLTDAECLTLALRLYKLRLAATGEMDKAPADWGRVTLTLADGTTFTRYGEYDPFFAYGWFDTTEGKVWQAYVLVNPKDSLEDRAAWAKAHEGDAVLTVEGKRWSGKVVADSDSNHHGHFLRFDYNGPAQAELTEALTDTTKPGPDKWYRDAVYTASIYAMEDAEGFSSLLYSLYQSGGAQTTRETFAKALASAAGELEKRYTVESIPDLPYRNTVTESIFTLYEAGILNGTDQFGSFSPSKGLTRAEAATMVARVLDESQRLSFLTSGPSDPDAPSSPVTPDAYDLAVMELRRGWGYLNEQTFETPDCTIFVYDKAGSMHSHTGVMTLIYKPGSQLGAGTVITLPHARVERSLLTYPADTMTLSQDKTTFTYTYYRPEDILDIDETEVYEQAGQVTYTVDLPTGEVTEAFAPPSYAGALAHVSRPRIKTSGENSKDRQVVRTLEAEDCTAVLTKGRYADLYDDFILSLVYKPGSALGEGTIRQLILPTTVIAKGYWYNPTDRIPDSLTLSEDGKTLRYTYYFPEALVDGETVYHEAGSYLYTVDLTTGEASVYIDPLSQQNLGYADAYQALTQEAGYVVAYDSSGGNNASVVLRYKPCRQDQSVPDYELYLLSRAAPSQVLRLALPSTALLSDGYAPTAREPDKLEFDLNGDTFTYTYRFLEPLWNGKTLLHDKGTYVYTVDVSTGEQSVRLEDSYEYALAQVLYDGWQIDQQLESGLCTVVAERSQSGNGGIYPGARISLVYKDGSPLGAGTVVDLPTQSGRVRYGSFLPDSMELDQAGNTLIYFYDYAEDQYAHTPPGTTYLAYEAGTYTYTVDLTTGTVNKEFIPKA